MWPRWPPLRGVKPLAQICKGKPLMHFPSLHHFLKHFYYLPPHTCPLQDGPGAGGSVFRQMRSSVEKPLCGLCADRVVLGQGLVCRERHPLSGDKLTSGSRTS